MLRRTAIASIALSVLAVGGVGAAMDELLPPLVVVRKLSLGELKGKTVNQALWSRPAQITRFDCDMVGVDWTVIGSPVTQQTEVRLAYDDANLYVAFRCFETNLDKLESGHTTMWKNDSVSLRTIRDGNTTDRFDIGMTPDGKTHGGGPNAESKAEMGREADAWTVIMTIPFSAMNTTCPKIGAVWSMNSDRTRKNVKEDTYWSRVITGTNQKSTYGRVVFGSADAPTISASSAALRAPGKHSVTMAILNPTAKPVEMVADILSDGKRIQQDRYSAPPGSSEWKTTVNYPHDGWHDVNIEVRKTAGNVVLMRTMPERARIPAHYTTLAKCRGILDSLKPPSSAALGDRAKVEGELADVKSVLQAAEGDPAKWKTFQKRVAELEKSVTHIRSVCLDTEERGYVVGTETALTKVMRDRLFEGEFGQPAAVSACKNEYESTQIVLFPHDRELKDVAVSVSALKGPKGAEIPVDRVKLNLVEFVETQLPTYEVDYVGWYPDPLMEMTPFNAPVDLPRPIWITVHPPEGIPGGMYTGEITIRPANSAETKVPLHVKVWDFSIPTKPRMKTAFAMFNYELGGWYGKQTEQMRKDYYAFLLEHRINVCNIYNGTPIPDEGDVPFCVERGQNMLGLTNLNYRDDKARQEFVGWMRPYEKYLRENNWWDMAYIYGFDEAGRDKYAQIREMFGWVREQFPGIQRMTTVPPTDALKGYVDIFVPLTGDWVQETVAHYVESGSQVWWYVCCNPQHPYTNFYVDYPAIDPRITFWMAWKYQIPGFLYYAINLWDTNFNMKADGHVPRDPKVREQITAGKRWPEVPWNTLTCASFNGDGHLIYPGPGGKPLSSIRFEAIRDGIEDYEFFYQLESLVKTPKADPALVAKAKKLLAVREDVVKSLIAYNLDPQALMAAREEVAEMIEKLSRK